MFRILSLDGGGIKGAFSAAVMAALERKTGKAAADDFDLIVVTRPQSLARLATEL